MRLMALRAMTLVSLVIEAIVATAGAAAADVVGVFSVKSSAEMTLAGVMPVGVILIGTSNMAS